LLTPIAGDLHMTEGQVGQSIAMSGIFAVVTSLFIASVSRRIDRKLLLVLLTAVMLASGLIVATAPSYAMFMIGHALLGIAIGGCRIADVARG
jgi:predicted MFS family arabinose efflux permease